MSGNPQRKYRADYAVPAYLIDTVDLDFDIRDTQTAVRAVYAVRRNPDSTDTQQWRLDGRDMRFVSVAIDDRQLSENEYRLTDDALVVDNPPERFTLAVENVIDPEHNLSLEGFYRSGDILCSQCEANGFSRITYFPDRPDVMARYTTRISADAKTFPVLLANGNCVDSGELDGGRHYAVFEDPFAKPCYLFAIVAGDLGVIQDCYTTTSGREVDLRLYTEHGNEDQCHHAMASLKQAMAWDEDTYGLEYDLHSYVTVAVGSFNMGAMENKGLNVFNTACIFAARQTATDNPPASRHARSHTASGQSRPRPRPPQTMKSARPRSSPTPAHTAPHHSTPSVSPPNKNGARKTGPRKIVARSNQTLMM